MKKTAVTFGIMLLGGLAFGQTDFRKQDKVSEPGAPVFETLRSATHRADESVRPSEEIKTVLADEVPVRGADVRAKSGKAVKAAVQPPYRCGFDNADVLDDEWIVKDGDRDGKTWYWRNHTNYATYNGDTTSGFVLSLFNSKQEQADFLIMRSPVAMPAGKAYVGFHYGSKMAGFKGRLRVYYGDNPNETNVDKLTLVGEHMDSVVGWRHKVMNFNVEKSGDYFFYIVNCSPADQFGVWLDNVEIGTGDYVGYKPELKVERLVLPASSCELGTENIRVRIANTGLTAITKIELTYTVNGGTPVTQTFEKNIGVSESAAFDFDQKADFSKEGGEYKVEVSAKLVASVSGGEETRLDDNVAAGSVRHFEPIEVPFEADFRKEEGLAQMGFGTDYWVADADGKGLNGLMAEAPLQTRCINLEAGSKYRVTFHYMAGNIMMGQYVFPSKFDVVYGLSGTSVTGWGVLKTYDNEEGYTAGEFVMDELLAEPSATGVYSFAIVPKADELGKFNGALYISDFAVDAVRGHDIKIAGIRSSIGGNTPVRHAVNPSFVVSVVNRGIADETVKVTVKKGETVVGTSRTSTIKLGDTARCKVEGVLSGLAEDSDVTLTFLAEMGAEDEFPRDNTREWTFKATDELYAFDDVSIEDYADAISLTGYVFGEVFTLTERDTLTAVELGWYDLAASVATPFEVGLEIYAVDAEDKLTSCVLYTEFVRQLRGGAQMVEIPARVLPAGRYFIGVRQLTPRHIGMGFDDNPDGYCYFAADGRVWMLPDYGFVAVRAVLGRPVSAPAKDIVVERISKPREQGIFAANERIEADYINNGHAAMEVEFKCTVGDQVQTQKLTVPGYGFGTVKFKADLSATGLHTIRVEAVADGDEDLKNNVVEKVVECAVRNPYVMDFELCDDFAITGLEPWTTVDMDKAATVGIEGVIWPNAGSPQAFMAFNPSAVPINSIAPHEGERMGAVWASSKTRNNDWLISPQLRLPTENASMSFFAKAVSSSYKEEYNVLVSTADGNPESGAFEQIGDTYTASNSWEEITVDLSDYRGKEVYIAIQCVSDNAWAFLIDDIYVSRPLPNERVDDLSAWVKAYPNPVADMWTVTAYGVEINRVEISNVMGTVVYRSAGNMATETYRIDMADFTPGLYVARIYTKIGVQSIKITVR